MLKKWRGIRISAQTTREVKPPIYPSAAHAYYVMPIAYVVSVMKWSKSLHSVFQNNTLIAKL